MTQLMIVRRLTLQPGRINEAVKWIKAKEADRRKAGQVFQVLAKSMTDPHEYMFVQVWESRDAYNRWSKSPERAALAEERKTLFAHEPILYYQVL
ncbi:MAG: antibiotic biosynthesis monooxygenase [Chloroflexi bacterium]|nr:antibiotic biosynthesis monooxygenase [Chloroflexota bacterium]